VSSPATAWEALAVLRAAGLTVTARGQTLWLKPSRLATPELVELARQHKRTLLKALVPIPEQWESAHADPIPPGVCADCGGPAPRDGRHWCADCQRTGSTT
jgi:hypothetical protein